jgi:hypothetical protein
MSYNLSMLVRTYARLYLDIIELDARSTRGVVLPRSTPPHK